MEERTSPSSYTDFTDSVISEQNLYRNCTGLVVEKQTGNVLH